MVGGGGDAAGGDGGGVDGVAGGAPIAGAWGVCGFTGALVYRERRWDAPGVSSTGVRPGGDAIAPPLAAAQLCHAAIVSMGQGDINKLELVLQQRAGVPLEQEDIPLEQDDVRKQQEDIPLEREGVA